jgi:hypothetical protein
MLQLRGIVTTHRHSLWCRKFDHGSHHHLTTRTHSFLDHTLPSFLPFLFFSSLPARPHRHNHVIPNTHTQPPPNPSIPAPSARLAQPPHTTQPHPPLPSSSYQTRTRQQQRLKPTPHSTLHTTLHASHGQPAGTRTLAPTTTTTTPTTTPTPPSIPTTHDPSRNKEPRRRRRPRGPFASGDRGRWTVESASGVRACAFAPASGACLLLHRRLPFAPLGGRLGGRLVRRRCCCARARG